MAKRALAAALSEVLQMSFAFPKELIVDLFAGGGGASLAIEQAFGRPVDIAVNHSRSAVDMHTVNHPSTRHFCEDVYQIDPYAVTAGVPVGLLHASPDCTHHSQASGGQPRDRAVRSLSWVVLKWAGTVRPRVITLENVEQILQWSPLIAKRDRATGRVVALDKVLSADGKRVNRIADPGERVPLRNQYLVADPKRVGETWRKFVDALRALGYAVQWRKLKACDYGAGTRRERLFMVARCDGLPIRWPVPTHGKGRTPYRVAADGIDFTRPVRSIFDRPRPLAPTTLRRIAKGIVRFVLRNPKPYIVKTNHTGEGYDAFRGQPIDDPLGTNTSRNGYGVVAPTLVPRYGERPGQEPRASRVDEPMPTVVPTGNGATLATATLVEIANYGRDGGVAPVDEPHRTITAGPKGGSSAAIVAHMTAFGQNAVGSACDEPAQTALAGAQRFGLVTTHVTKLRTGSIGTAADEPLDTICSGGATTRPAAAHAMGVVAAYLEQASNGGMLGRPIDEPSTTIMSSGTQQRLVTAHLSSFQTSNTCGGNGDPAQPIRTLLAGGTHQPLIECELSPEAAAGAERVAAFLMTYYGTGGQWADLGLPSPPVTTRDRLALVTVTLGGTDYVITDIGMRMLDPDELFACQGFPPSYVIDRRPDGRKLPKYEQTHMCGNSVSPPPMRALVECNVGELVAAESRAA